VAAELFLIMKRVKQLTKPEEIEVIDRAKLGDKDAFNIIFTKNMATFDRAVAKLVKDHDEKNDMLSYIYEKVLNNICKYKEHDNFQGWLATLSKNATIDYLRHKKIVQKRESRYDNVNPDILDHMSTLTDYAESAEDAMVRQERYNKLDKEMAKLPEMTKLIVEMKADKKTVREISNALSITESAVKGRFLKAQSILKDNLISA
jgi:RNA polymerase sigma-70 factor (ECF subfamily)